MKIYYKFDISTRHIIIIFFCVVNTNENKIVYLNLLPTEIQCLKYEKKLNNILIHMQNIENCPLTTKIDFFFNILLENDLHDICCIKYKKNSTKTYFGDLADTNNLRMFTRI